eukprot:GHVR01141469.1.p1 GENE.GHVR01141469.1~~GHVR01141469.1.p1  ORF type:complete len:498 (-),score=61.58 GHVR01141469.1:122-1615(-)
MESLRDSLSSLYKQINGKSFHTHHIKVFLSDDLFPVFINSLLADLSEHILDPSIRSLYVKSNLVEEFRTIPEKLANLRGYYIPAESSNWRELFLKEIIADIQMARVRDKKIFYNSLTLTQMDDKASSMKVVTDFLRKYSDCCGDPSNINVLGDSILPLKLVEENLSANPSSINKDVLIREANEHEVETFKSLCDDMNNEYGCRADMMIGRFNVSAEAMAWSAKLKTNADLYTKFHELANTTAMWKINPSTFSILDVLGATREDVLKCSRVSSIRTDGLVQETRNVKIGKVPGRGGVPEGYSRHRLKEDVRKANESMKGIKGDTQRKRGSNNALDKTQQNKKNFKNNRTYDNEKETWQQQQQRGGPPPPPPPQNRQGGYGGGQATSYGGQEHHGVYRGRHDQTQYHQYNQTPHSQCNYQDYQQQEHQQQQNQNNTRSYGYNTQQWYGYDHQQQGYHQHGNQKQIRGRNLEQEDNYVQNQQYSQAGMGGQNMYQRKPKQ